MGYIKKLKNNELIGGTDKTAIYPVTSTEAVFEEITEGNESSFKSQKTINKEQQDTLDAHNGRVTYLENHAVKSVTINGGTKTYTVDDVGNVNLDVYTTESAEGQATLAEEVGDIRSIVGTKDSPASDTLVNRVGELETLVGGSGEGSVNTRIANTKAQILGDAAEDYNTLGKVEDKIQEEVARATAEETELSIYIHAIEGGNIRVKTSTPTNPDTGAPANTVYRVAGTTTYSDYMWNGTTMVKMAEYNVNTLESQFGYYKWETASNTISITTSNQVAGSPIGSYVLTAGGSFKIKMTNKATGACTLNMNGTGVKTLLYNGDPIDSSNTWEAGEAISVYYDGNVYQASNAQGGSNKKINAYLYGDLRTLAVGQNYEIDESVKTTDKQFRRTTKEIKTLSLSEELAIGDIRTSSNATYRADDTINTYDPEGDYSEHPYALGSFAEYTYTVAAESVTAGNITVNGTEVAVEETDDAATIAAKIAAALIIDGWTTSVADNVVIVRCNTIGNNTTTIVIDPDTENTGITVEESSVAGTSVIRKYDGETWADATVAGMVEDGILAAVDEAWLIANATIQNTIVRDINWYASLDNKDGDFTWEVGNIINGVIVTYYSNRYTIFNKNSLGENVDSFTIYNGGISGKTFALHYYNGSKYIYISDLKIGNNVINAIGRQQFLILVWDKPTAAQTASCSLRIFAETKAKDVIEKHEERIADLENNLSVEDIHYSSELYKNADGDFAWKTGNPSNPQYPSVANKYFIVDVGRKINKLKIYKTNSSCYMYVCAVVGNSYIGLLGNKSINTTTDLSNHNYTKIYCLLYKDSGTPTTDEALAETIELTFDFALDGELDSLETRVSTLESSAGALKFTNPVIKTDYADPDIWNGEDGYWYAYATGHLTNGKKTMYRSANLVNWEDTGEHPFTQAALDSWEAQGKDTFWAPEVAKIGDHWNIYISSTAEPLYVFTSKQPTSGFNLVKAIMHSGISGSVENIDACVRYDREGKLWMFWSTRNGICRIRLSDDGLSIAEEAVLEHVAGLPHAQDTSDRAHTFEAPYLYRRKGYWYLIVSAGLYNNNTYCLRVGRCATLDGTFVDKEGNLMTEGNGSLLLTGSGNFYGPGHNGRIITDKDNKTWMLFHSHWTGVSSSARPMCISEVLWDEDGWPYFVNNTLTASGIGPRM